MNPNDELAVAVVHIFVSRTIAFTNCDLGGPVPADVVNDAFGWKMIYERVAYLKSEIVLKEVSDGRSKQKLKRAINKIIGLC
jgi:hypothetical protein